MHSKKNISRFSDWVLGRPAFSGFVVFLLLLFTGTYITWLSYNNLRKNRQSEVQNISRVIEQNIDRALDNCRLAAISLALTINDKGEPENFEAVASNLVNTYSIVDAVQLVPQGVISHVYPYESNKKALGYNILLDSTRNKEAYKAIAARRMFFAGPFELRQGGVGVVGRIPVFRNNQFWGFAAVIIHLNTLLRNSGIDQLDKGDYHFQLSKLDPETNQLQFFLPEESNNKTEHLVSIFIHEGDWTLSISSVSGIITYYGIIALGILSFLLSLVSSLFVTHLLKKPAALHELVETQSEELHRINMRNKGILQTLPDMLFIVDSKGIFKHHHNPQQMDTLAPPEFFLGKHISDVMPPEIARDIIVNIAKTLETKDLLLHDYELPDETGQRYFEARYAPISEKEVLVIVREITLEKTTQQEILKKNEELKVLSDHLQSVREDERAALSRELHDVLGQQLTAIGLDLQWIKKSGNVSGNSVIEKVDDALTMTQQASAAVKRINTELRPSILDDLGLLPAIEWQLNDFTDRYGIPSEFSCDFDELNILSSKSIAIFRIVQEALNNIAKHAHAKKVLVHMIQMEGKLKIIIQDDGIGFDLKLIEKNVSFGLIGMRERANMLHGELDIKSKPGEGTKIELNVPLQILLEGQEKTISSDIQAEFRDPSAF